MKGLELSRKFYNEIGKPMLCEQFSEVLPYLSVGLAGSGSECFGFDDEISQDHDFEPAFCIFVPDALDDKTLFSLSRAYLKLPKSFDGFERKVAGNIGGRHGVIKISDFFLEKTGTPDGELSLYDWLSVPESALYEAVNGEIFFDNYGEITKIREKLSYYPEDIRLKKLAGYALLMGQAGQYNYLRIISRGDTAAAQLAAIEFVKSAISAIFLINKTYMPYYKWSFRALSLLPKLSHLAPTLEEIISSGNEQPREKSGKIEKICAAIANELGASGNDMEQLAYAINDKITDNNLRNMHVLCGV